MKNNKASGIDNLPALTGILRFYSINVLMTWKSGVITISQSPQLPVKKTH